MFSADASHLCYPSFMLQRLRYAAIFTGLLSLILNGFAIPRLPFHRLDLDPVVSKAILDEARTDFDAPLMELVTIPTYRIMDFSGTTARVGIYTWFGFRAATMTITDCKPYPSDDYPYFGCGGNTVSYP